jgi:hypothetical protein
LCVLCDAVATVEFPARGAEMPGALLCDHCAGLARKQLVTLGWCQVGRHYGRPLHICRRHRIQFVSLGTPDRWRRRRPT